MTRRGGLKDSGKLLCFGSCVEDVHRSDGTLEGYSDSLTGRPSRDPKESPGVGLERRPRLGTETTFTTYRSGPAGGRTNGLYRETMDDGSFFPLSTSWYDPVVRKPEPLRESLRRLKGCRTTPRFVLFFLVLSFATYGTPETFYKFFK